jgi:hypothetical protein
LRSGTLANEYALVEPGYRAVTVNITTLRNYARAVFTRSEEFVRSIRRASALL